MGDGMRPLPAEAIQLLILILQHAYLGRQLEDAFFVFALDWRGCTLRSSALLRERYSSRMMLFLICVTVYSSFRSRLHSRARDSYDI